MYRTPSHRTPSDGMFPAIESLERRLCLSGRGLLVSTPNHLSDGQTINQYTLSGGRTDGIDVPLAGDRPVRDVVVDATGNIQAFVGTTSPYLATFDGKNWTQHTFAGWKSDNVVGDGGVASFGNYVYVTSEDNAGGSPGIVRFDAANGYSAKLFAGPSYRDVTMGLDGKLYALTEPGVAASQVDAYDPLTMRKLSTTPLPFGNEAAVAVDQDGFMYVCGGPGLYVIDPSGAVATTTAANGGTDVDVSDDFILVTNFQGKATVTGTALNPISQFTPLTGDAGESYVAFDTYNGPADAPAAVTGAVYNDADANGARGKSETGLAGVRVYADLNRNGIYNAGEPTALTGKKGLYELAGLPAGRSYPVRQQPPAGYRQTAPSARSYFQLAATTGRIFSGNNFANTAKAKFSGTIYNDADADRRQETGENGLAGVILFLDANRNGAQDKGESFAKTDAAGNYVFDDVLAGTYTVQVQGLTRYAPTTPGGKFTLTLAAAQVKKGQNVGEQRR